MWISENEIYKKQSEKFEDLTSPIGTESLTAVIADDGMRCIKYIHIKNIAEGIRSKRKETDCSVLVSLQKNRNGIIFMFLVKFLVKQKTAVC